MLPPPPIRGVYRTDLRARAAYSEAAGIYRIVPAAVCLPLDHQDVVALLYWAAAHRVPLVPRGAGSAMGGGNVGDGVLVDLTRLERRLEVRPEERLAVTSANRSGGPETLTDVEARDVFGDEVDLYVEGVSPGGEASTVVDATGAELTVLRQGPVTI